MEQRQDNNNRILNNGSNRRSGRRGEDELLEEGSVSTSPPVTTDQHVQPHRHNNYSERRARWFLQQQQQKPVLTGDLPTSVSTSIPKSSTASNSSSDYCIIPPTTSTTASTLAMEEPEDETLEEQEALEASSPHHHQEEEEETRPVVAREDNKVGSPSSSRRNHSGDMCDGRRAPPASAGAVSGTNPSSSSSASAMFYYYCPLPVGAPWRNMYNRRRCLMYAVALAGVCCLVLVLGVVIWRVSSGSGGPSSSGREDLVGQPGETQQVRAGYVVETAVEQMGTQKEDIPDTPTPRAQPLLPTTHPTKNQREPQSEVKRFTANGSDFFKILHTDTMSDSIIVGAKNMVYNISLTKSRLLQINKHIEWKSEDHVVQICRSRRKSEEACQNYISLVVNQTTGDLFVCGTNAFKPECRVYRSTPGSYAQIDSSPGVAVCPYDPHQNNTFTYADGSLYTGTIADANGRDSLIYRNPTRTVQHDSQMLNDPDFVSSFEHGDNVYFFFREFAVEYINCGKAIYSRVGRVCKKDQGGGAILRDIWTSFFKSRLNCSIPGDFPFYFDEIQSTSLLGSGSFMPVSDPSNRTEMIYAVFNTPENSISGSAICAFRMSDIVAAFEGGFKEQKSVYSTWLAVNEQDTPKPHPTMCVNDSRALPVQTQNFIKSHPLMDRAVPAFGNRPILVQTSLTSRMTQVAIDWQREAVDGRFYDVLFIGKNDGTVLKAINKGKGAKMDTVIIEEIRVFSSGQPVTGLKVHRSQGREHIEVLLVVSRSEMKTIPLHRCSQHKTCRACVSLRDPYCSWDQNRCRANTLHGKQNIESGTGCDDDRTLPGENDIASSSSPSVPTSTPCVCPEQRVVGIHPTNPADNTERRNNDHTATTSMTDDKEANRIIDSSDNTHSDENSIPNVGSHRQPKDHPEVGASTQVRGDTVSASTLAISLVFSILIALIVGFVAGYRTSVYRHKEGHMEDFFMSGPKGGEGLKNLNSRFDPPDSNRYNTHDYLPQPRTEKQLNVVFNPLKPNSKLPNGSAQTEVQKQKAKKVYL